MRRRRSKAKSTDTGVSGNDRFRAPIITEHLVIREATRADAADLESTMPTIREGEAPRTADGARRFGAGLHDTPVWSGTRAVSEKGLVRIVGGVVITKEEPEESATYRIGWWLESGVEQHGAELVSGVDQRLRELGARRVVMHVRADDDVALGAAGRAEFIRGRAVQHSAATGRPLEFWEYVREADSGADE